jgi:hypothetical protein
MIGGDAGGMMPGSGSYDMPGGGSGGHDMPGGGYDMGGGGGYGPPGGMMPDMGGMMGQGMMGPGAL